MNKTTSKNQIGLKVLKSNGEHIRLILKERNLLDSTLRIYQDRVHIIIPLSEELSEEEISVLLPETDSGYEMVRHDFLFSLNSRFPSDYRSFLSDIDEELQRSLPTSFDVIGDLCIIKLREEVIPFSERIGKAILATVPSIKGVFRDLGVQGEFRLRSLRHMGGVQRTCTTHREYQMRLNVDIGQTYFSPRLAGERFRIANLIRQETESSSEIEKTELRDETNDHAYNLVEGKKKSSTKPYHILDMFAGVGPFSIGIARVCPRHSIHAIDSNPNAIEFLRHNILLNKVTNIIPHFGDARSIVSILSQKLRFQRIIMNLPHESIDFLHCALEAIDKGTIHLYVICEKDDRFEITEAIRKKIEGKGKDLDEINSIELKGYSPTGAFYAFDVSVS